MKRLISIVLIISCLGLCACKSKEKDSKPKDDYNKDAINSAFYSCDSTEELFKKREYLDYSELFDELTDQLIDQNKHTPVDGYKDIASRTVGDKLICMQRSGNYCVMDTYGFLSTSLSFGTDPTLQGLYCSIMIYEMPSKSVDDYDKMYLAHGGYDNDCETAEGVRIHYGIETFGSYGRYNVLLVSQDKESEHVVVMTYAIPTIDNEEEIQELRDLGVPVVTDFVK